MLKHERFALLLFSATMASFARLASAAPAFPTDSASPGLATASWTDPTLTGALDASTAITGTVLNSSRAPLWVRVSIVALGLDDRLVVRELTVVRTAPDEPTTVPVQLSQVPVQSVGSETAFWLRAQVVSPAGDPSGPATDGRHLSAEWSANYATVTLHGDRGADLDRSQPRPSASSAEWLAATRGAFHRLGAPVGATWNGAGFVDVTSLPRGDDRLTLALRGQWAADYREWAPTLVTGYTSPRNAGWYRVCLAWHAFFIDNQTSNGLSDDNLTGTESPARYAKSTLLTDELVPAVVWNGALDRSGCTPALRLGGGARFTLLAMSDLVKPEGTGALISYLEGSTTPLAIAEGFVSPATGGGSSAAPEIVQLTPAVEDMATRVAAVAGQVLDEDEILPAGFVARIFANAGCPDAWAIDVNGLKTEACAGNGRVRIGYVLDTARRRLDPHQHNSQFKFIVAHELGHVIGEAAFGVPHWTPGQDGIGDAACRCDHVRSGNATHCLTSRQDQSFALNEAFGHFIAARAFNDGRGKDCSFAYYKTSVDGQRPPQNVSCTGAPRWLETRCAADAEYGGTELDWLTFYYDVTRGADAITLTDLAESFRRACSGSPTGRCASQYVYFNRMPATNRGTAQPTSSLADGYCAALSARGGLPCSLNPKFARFMTDAANHGIVH